MARAKRYKAISEYYDAEYSANEMLQQDVPFFLGHLPKRRRDVLELAVGTARAAIPIVQAGHRVVGVDNDAGVLEVGKVKRDAVGIAEPELQLLRQDVLKLELGRKFDWVCIFFNTLLNFTTLEDLDRLMQVVRRHLRPAGKFWFDVYHPDLQRLARGHAERVEPSSFYVPSLDRSVYREMEIDVDPVRQVQHVTFHYQWFDRMGQEHDEHVAFDLTWLFPRELRMLLERNGLRLERLYGDYDASEVGPESPRLIGVAGLA